MIFSRLFKVQSLIVIFFVKGVGRLGHFTPHRFLLQISYLNKFMKNERQRTIIMPDCFGGKQLVINNCVKSVPTARFLIHLTLTLTF